MGWAGRGGQDARTLLGVSRAAVFTFHLLEGKKQGIFFVAVVISFYFS